MRLKVLARGASAGATSIAPPSEQQTQAPSASPHGLRLSRWQEYAIGALAVAWLAFIVWLTFADPLSSTNGAGCGFIFVVAGLLIGAYDLIVPPRPCTRVLLAFFATMTGTAFVGYREFALAAGKLGFHAGFLFLGVVTLVVLYTFYVIRRFR
jgi:hypothetical protein